MKTGGTRKIQRKQRSAIGRPQRATPGDPGKVGKRGMVVIPSRLRRAFGIDEGSFVLFESHQEGILIRPAEVIPVEVYTAERKAEFLLNGATSAQSYRWAVKEVRRMGLDPAKIQHRKPGQD